MSCIRYHRWLTEYFVLQYGVQQGYPLSCHLFNFVGQVLIYSLRDHSYFEWWKFLGDPCSLYADDIAFFISDISQLASVIKGPFTGLELNINKTIAFDSSVQGKLQVAGVTMGSAPVKYLGIILGIRDLSKQNFERPWRTAKVVAARWSKCSLTLDARILVIKTFIFSLFVHVLNCTIITVSQLDLVQKLCTNFLWRGRLKIQYSVICSSYENGGMNMLHVKATLNAL